MDTPSIKSLFKNEDLQIFEDKGKKNLTTLFDSEESYF